MAVSLNPRAERLLARMPRMSVYSALELALLLLIAVQCARLFWGVVTPLGPVGAYKALDQMRPVPPAGASLGTFDPFFRDAQAQPAQATVTNLDIRLYGITSNRATGGGSAIIGPANGDQRIFVVGEEIMPGVTLTGVGFDHVVITRNGATEQLYLDQTPSGGPGSTPPPQIVAPPPVPTGAPQPPIGAPQPPVPTVTATPPGMAPVQPPRNP